MLILRADKGELEHYEPHGGEYTGNEKLQEQSKTILVFFVDILNKEFKKNNIPPVHYVDASHVCPYINGLQQLEGDSTLRKKGKLEPRGYCIAWTIFFAELCLRNPELSSTELLNNVYNYLTTKESGPNYLKGVIRGYAGLLTQQVNKYLSIFFKPNLTVSYLNRHPTTHAYRNLLNALDVLVDLETYIMMNLEFDLKKELKNAKKEYNELTKGKTKEEQIQMRRGPNSIKKVELAYYKKRILQNYEEYKRSGSVSEAIFDSPEEINKEQIRNLGILKKGLLHERLVDERKNIEGTKTKKQRNTDRTKTQKYKIPTQLKEAFDDDKEKKKFIEKIIKKENIDMTTREGQHKLLQILQDLGRKS